jgi:hypothetical protein
MQIRDRIKELRRVRAKVLRPNPRNWRTHSAAQRDALRGVLAEIGYADALLARECQDGGLVLLDGHLRAETTPDSEVPVLVLDLDEAEADKLLATLDPLAAMAGADKEQLDSLLREVQTDNDAVQRLLDELSADTLEKHIEALANAQADLECRAPTGEDNGWRNFHLVLTAEQETAVRGALKAAKVKYGVETSSDALSLLTKEWLDAQHP